MIRKQRCEAVKEASSRIEKLTGCRVVHASKGNGSMRPYLHITIEAPAEWPLSFTETIREGWNEGEEYPSLASRWLLTRGLPPIWLSAEFGHYWKDNDQIPITTQLSFTLYWRDLYKMGWSIPELRTPGEITGGASLVQHV